MAALNKPSVLVTLALVDGQQGTYDLGKSHPFANLVPPNLPSNCFNSRMSDKSCLLLLITYEGLVLSSKDSNRIEAASNSSVF